MASANTNKTIIAIGVVAIAGYVAYKALPKLLKKLGTGGTGGSGGAGGASSYAPYNPYATNPGQQSGSPNFSATGTFGPKNPGGTGSTYNPDAATYLPGAATPLANQAYADDLAAQTRDADMPGPTGSAATGFGDLSDRINALLGFGSSDTATLQPGGFTSLDDQAYTADLAAQTEDADMPDPTGSASTGFGDLSDWLNEALGFSNPDTSTNSGLDPGLIPYEQVQTYDQSQNQQSVSNADDPGVSAANNNSDDNDSPSDQDSEDSNGDAGNGGDGGGSYGDAGGSAY